MLEAELKLLEERWKDTERGAREADAKAKAIEEVVYGLKAVNPNRASAEDTPTPAELLDFIAEKGGEARCGIGTFDRTDFWAVIPWLQQTTP